MSARYVCPACGREVLSPSILCSGGFLDENHPSNVQPVAAEPPVSGQVAPREEEV
jgi:hypothetical protein